MQLQCKLCKKYVPLIKAHIIPKFFFLQTNMFLSYKNNFTKKRPSGTYDQKILCEKCDGFLGKFDNYAKDILIDKKSVIKKISVNPINPTQSSNFYELADETKYIYLAKFFISILWRASISSHEDFEDFNLGSYEDTAKNFIISSSSESNNIFSVMLCYLPDVLKPFHLLPTMIKIEDVNFYTLITGFYKVFIKCDTKPMPERMKKFFLCPYNNHLMVEEKLSIMPEFNVLTDMIENVNKYKKSSSKHRK